MIEHDDPAAVTRFGRLRPVSPLSASRSHRTTTCTAGMVRGRSSSPKPAIVRASRSLGPLADLIDQSLAVERRRRAWTWPIDEDNLAVEETL